MNDIIKMNIMGDPSCGKSDYIIIFDDVSFLNDLTKSKWYERIFDFFKCEANPTKSNHLQYTLKQYRKNRRMKIWTSKKD